MCEMWPELGARPFSFQVSVKLALAFSTSTVPPTPLAFSCWTWKTRGFGLGLAAGEAVPPQAAATRARNTGTAICFMGLTSRELVGPVAQPRAQAHLLQQPARAAPAVAVQARVAEREHDVLEGVEHGQQV